MENIFFLLGAYALIFLAVSAINSHRDGLKMSFLASVVRKSLNGRSSWNNVRLGLATMLIEGDSMRATSALAGFANGRVIDQLQTAQALVASYVSKCIWVWVACLLTLLSTYFEMGWILFMGVGAVIVLCRISNGMDTLGNMLIYCGLLLLGIMFAITAVSNFTVSSFPLWSYTVYSDVVGVVLSAFAGVIIGALVSGNLLSLFFILPFVVCGFVGVECSVAFVVGTEAGTLFPMSLMVSDTTLRSRNAFLLLSLVVGIAWIIDTILFSVLDLSFLSSFGVTGFAVAYTLFFSVMLAVIYFVSGMTLWAKVSDVTKSATADPKRHLHRFAKEYSPHVSLLLLQAEREIVNLQFRIHKMLDFTIDLVDEEDGEASLEHIRKYREIVIRTAREITDFIVAQTSMKNNAHVSEFATERLHAVDLQCQIGNMFCDMAEAIRKSDKSQYPIIRRCVVALETLYNLATKLINSRFNSHSAEGDILEEDVENLSHQFVELTEEFGGDPVCDVLPYTFCRSRKIILEIIQYLKYD